MRLTRWASLRFGLAAFCLAACGSCEKKPMLPPAAPVEARAALVAKAALSGVRLPIPGSSTACIEDLDCAVAVVGRGCCAFGNFIPVSWRDSNGAAHVLAAAETWRAACAEQCAFDAVPVCRTGSCVAWPFGEYGPEKQRLRAAAALELAVQAEPALEAAVLSIRGDLHDCCSEAGSARLVVSRTADGAFEAEGEPGDTSFERCLRARLRTPTGATSALRGPVTLECREPARPWESGPEVVRVSPEERQRLVTEARAVREAGRPPLPEVKDLRCRVDGDCLLVTVGCCHELAASWADPETVQHLIRAAATRPTKCDRKCPGRVQAACRWGVCGVESVPW